jgi:hypothetical protein
VELLEQALQFGKQFWQDASVSMREGLQEVQEDKLAD